MSLRTPPENDPAKWTLGQLAEVARKARRLPSTWPTAQSEMFTDHDGQAGDALRFAERLRNMIAHPGAYVRETLRPDLDNEQHLQLTYQLIDGILAEVFEHLAKQTNTLGVQAKNTELSVGGPVQTGKTSGTVRASDLRNNR